MANCFYVHHEECYFGVYFTRCEATREINTKITFEWAQKQFVATVHALFYFLHDMMNSNMTISFAEFTFYWSRLSQSIADDVTNAIDEATILTPVREQRYLTHWYRFYSRHIQDRSCKKLRYQMAWHRCWFDKRSLVNWPICHTFWYN